MIYSGVISRGTLGGGTPLVKTFDHFGGSAPLKFLHWPCFSKIIDLASKVFSTAMLNYKLLRGYELLRGY